jgi:DNA integrity scanning protein DisA with diadenylate cyclase activity
MIIELGVDARLLRLQLDELYGEVDEEIELVHADYPMITGNYAGTGMDGDAVASPAGLRLLSRVPRMTPCAGDGGGRAIR